MASFLDSIKKQKQFSSELSVSTLPIDKIEPDTGQVRKSFDEEKLKELAVSIREKGIQNPLHVRLSQENPGNYIIITGERRYRAAKMLEMSQVPCIVHAEEMTAKDIRALQLIENLQREDLNVIEKARGFQALVEEGLNQSEVAQTLGTTEGTVSKSLAVLAKLPPDWIEQIEKICAAGHEIALYQVYNIAKEENTNRKRSLFDKLVSQKTDAEKQSEQTQEEDVSAEEKPEETTRKSKKDFTGDEVWDALKKIARKDKHLLLQYFSLNKLKQLLEVIEDEEIFTKE